MREIERDRQTYIRTENRETETENIIYSSKTFYFTKYMYLIPRKQFVLNFIQSVNAKLFICNLLPSDFYIFSWLIFFLFVYCAFVVSNQFPIFQFNALTICNIYIDLLTVYIFSLFRSAWPFLISSQIILTVHACKISLKLDRYDRKLYGFFLYIYKKNLILWMIEMCAGC